MPVPLAVTHWQCLRGFHLNFELNNAALKAVALDARESLHTLASDTHLLSALKGPAADLQDHHA